MSQPRGGYGPRISRNCYKCSRKRTCYRFNCGSRFVMRVTGAMDSPTRPIPLCQECACDVFGVDAIESEIANGKLSWPSQIPTQADSEQLSLIEEQ